MSFDSRPETRKHIERVQFFVMQVVGNLAERASRHDASKLESPEVEAFDIATPKLASLVYGSPEYRAATDALGPALDHHYAANDHHPNHFPNGIDGMSLMALLEMICDWRAASERTKQRLDDPAKLATFASGLEFNFERFGIERQLAQIIRNTVIELGL